MKDSIVLCYLESDIQIPFYYHNGSLIIQPARNDVLVISTYICRRIYEILYEKQLGKISIYFYF